MSIDLKDFYGISVYHLGGIIVSSEMRGCGFSKEILEKDISECKSEILAFHTQSVLMESLGKKLSTPNIGLEISIAKYIDSKNITLLADGPIDKGRYGGKSLYGNVEKFQYLAIKRIGFDFKNGDAIIFAGFVKKNDI
ncbi:MAG: hypothetical protein GYA62_00115 [Bacteroidales bacterium]|nr:hypothetical protein [Bacteroidales bacterium]